MIKKTKKKSVNNKQLLTVRELKTWLDGYCSAHDNTWSPSLEQWELIRDKIFSLQENRHTEVNNYPAINPSAIKQPPIQTFRGAEEYTTTRTLPVVGRPYHIEPAAHQSQPLINTGMSSKLNDDVKEGESKSGDPSPFI